MKHEEIKKLIGAYVDGELHGKEKKTVEEHIKTCAECARECAYIKKLNEKIREDGIQLPADAYWDTFPRRVMERLKDQPKRSFLTFWLPRMKWELAGGIVVLLLTFVVSKQVFMKRSTEEIARGGRHSIAIGKGALEEKYYDSDGADMLKSEVSGETAERTADKLKDVEGGMVGAEEEKAPAGEKEAEIISPPETAPVIAKSGKAYDEENRDEEETEEPEVAKAGGLGESDDGGINDEGAVAKKEAPLATKAAVPEVAADVVAETETVDSNIRFAEASERSQHTQRGLLRLLNNEAGRTRKRADIERAMREIEFYQDSYPEDFQDTLFIFFDSLQQMIEEVERQEAEQAPAGENNGE